MPIGTNRFRSSAPPSSRCVSKGPVLCINYKKKRIVNLYRAGRCYRRSKALKVHDNDYDHLSEGKVVPHGIYYIKLKKGYISSGKGIETAEFVLDNLHWWWEDRGKRI